MPRYYIDIENDSYIIDKKIFERYIEAMPNMAEKAFLAVLYITGCRIIEPLQMTKSHIIERDKDIIMHLHTAKRRKAFRRTLYIGKNTPFLDVFLSYYNTCNDNLLFKFSKRTIQRRIQQANQEIHGDDKSKWIIAHQLRHSRASYWAVEVHTDVWEMQSWFGWKSIEPAQNYIHKVSSERLKDMIK